LPLASTNGSQSKQASGFSPNRAAILAEANKSFALIPLAEANGNEVFLVSNAEHFANLSYPIIFTLLICPILYLYLGSNSNR
jgi:hypothetical protein